MPIIRALSKHYKRKYHLNFVHAKKLFVIDMMLIALVFVTGILSLFWFFYDPTVLDDIELTIAADPDRFKSGELINYTINYKNNSETRLLNPTIKVDAPPGFLLQSAEPSISFDDEQALFSLPDMGPGQSGKVEVSGVFFGAPDKDEPLNVFLTYKQDGRQKSEQKISRHLTIARSSVLNTEVEISETILSRGEIPVEIRIKNLGKFKTPEISVPLKLQGDLSLSSSSLTDFWIINSLEPDEEAIFKGLLKSELSADVREAALKITPNINVGGVNIPQNPIKKALKIARPELDLTALWENSIAGPDQNVNLKITLKNTGDARLLNGVITIPLPTGDQLNHEFADLRAGETKNLTVPISLNGILLSGNDIKLSLHPQFTAKVEGIPGALFSANAISNELKIGTRLKMDSSIRYYTEEGDQLGRGPLPPKVGKETKYWAIINLGNGSSRVADLNFSAVLPDYVLPTGRVSVSHGQNLTINKNARTVTWQTPSLEPYGNLNLNFELSITPTDQQIGVAPVLIKNIGFSGFDSHIEQPIEISRTGLDASLPDDKIAKTRGVVVE